RDGRRAGRTCMVSDAGGYGESERLRRTVELTEKHSGLHTGRSSRRVHPDPLHQRQIDDHAAITNGVTREAVPSSSHRDEEAMRPGETYGGPDVRHPGATHNQRRVSVDRSVSYPPALLVARVTRTDEFPAQRRH